MKLKLNNLIQRGAYAQHALRLQTRRQRGFTFLELLIVMTILAILATVAIPAFLTNIKRARETRLQHDLWVMRDAIDKYTVDKEKAPDSLQELVNAGYLRAVPEDAITKEANWITSLDTAQEGTPGTFTVKSAAEGADSNGKAYNEY